MSGLLIAIEGIDGSGKSSLAAALAAALDTEARRCHTVRPLSPEPGFVDGVRSVHRLAGGSGAALQDDFLAAYFSYRLATAAVSTVIPLLAGGSIVVADRWLGSHRVNQRVFGQELDRFEPLFRVLPQPDVTLYVRIPLEIALDRLRSRARRGAGDNRAFLTSALDHFETLADDEGWAAIDGEGSLEQVAADALAAVERTAGLAVS